MCCCISFPQTPWLYVHTLVKNLLIKFLMMLFLVAKECKFDFCGLMDALSKYFIGLTYIELKLDLDGI